MRVAIQIIVIICAFLIISVVLRRRNTHSGKAWKKLAFILIALAMVASVFFPKVADLLASYVGVQSGADLFLYVIALSFIAYTVNNYLHQQDQRDVTYRLANHSRVVTQLLQSALSQI